MKFKFLIFNEGDAPTFFNSVRRQVIDITLVSGSHREHFIDWRVSNNYSLLDHAYITYDFNGVNGKAKPPY